MLRHFLYSCYKIQARKDKDLTSKMGLNLAEYLRQEKQDDLTLFSPVGTYAENVGTFLAGYIVLVFS